MSDQTALHDPQTERRATPWTRRLVLFLRIMAMISLAKGIYHWSLVLGIGDGSGSTFEQATMPWQAATVFFAVIDLVAASGFGSPPHGAASCGSPPRSRWRRSSCSSHRSTAGGS